MVHKLRDAVAAVENELNTTEHALSEFGSFKIKPVPLMKRRGWDFHLMSARRPPINSETITLIEQLFSKHLHAQGIEVGFRPEFLSDPEPSKVLFHGSVVDHVPEKSRTLPYLWLWGITLFKEKPQVEE